MRRINSYLRNTTIRVNVISQLLTVTRFNHCFLSSYINSWCASNYQFNVPLCFRMWEVTTSYDFTVEVLLFGMHKVRLQNLVKANSITQSCFIAVRANT